MSVRHGLVCKLNREVAASWFVTIRFDPFSWLTRTYLRRRRASPGQGSSEDCPLLPDKCIRLPEVIGSYSANKPQSLDPQEQSPYYLIADLYFENMGALQAALQSPQGQAAAGDLQNFASGGVTLVAGEVVVYDPVLIG